MLTHIDLDPSQIEFKYTPLQETQAVFFEKHTVSASANRLHRRYSDQLLYISDITLDNFLLWADGLSKTDRDPQKVAAAQLAAQGLCTQSKPYVDDDFHIDTTQLLASLWSAINDPNCIEDRQEAAFDAMFNGLAQFHPTFEPIEEKGIFRTTRASFAKLVLSFQNILPDIQVNVISRSQAQFLLFTAIKQAVTNHLRRRANPHTREGYYQFVNLRRAIDARGADVIWPSIEDWVIKKINSAYDIDFQNPEFFNIINEARHSHSYLGTLPYFREQLSSSRGYRLHQSMILRASASLGFPSKNFGSEEPRRLDLENPGLLKTAGR